MDGTELSQVSELGHCSDRAGSRGGIFHLRGAGMTDAGQKAQDECLKANRYMHFCFLKIQSQKYVPCLRSRHLSERLAQPSLEAAQGLHLPLAGACRLLSTPCAIASDACGLIHRQTRAELPTEKADRNDRAASCDDCTTASH